MKKNHTDITLIIDRSGSMWGLRNDVIGGFNQFLKDQQEVPGEATMSMVQFSDSVIQVFTRKPILEIEPLTTTTYITGGNTALLDAIGYTIKRMGLDYEKMAESDRPEKVILVIQTDGFENASTAFTTEQIKEMIDLQVKTYKWEVVYLGANQDAWAVGNAMGIPAASTMTTAADSKGYQDAYRSVSMSASLYRGGHTRNMEFSSADLKHQQR